MPLLQSTDLGIEMSKAPICSNIKQAELSLLRAFSYWFFERQSGRLAPSVAQFLDLHYKKRWVCLLCVYLFY